MLAALVFGGSAVAAVALFGPVTVAGAASITGTLATIGGVLGAENKYFKARRELIAKYPMAYLYEAQGGHWL